MNAFGKAAVLALAMVACATVGCANKQMKRMNVTVSVDKSVAGPGGVLPTMDVDLIGVTPEKLEDFKNMKMSEYWQALSGRRNDAKPYTYTMTFSHAQQAPQTLGKKDKIWDTWKQNGTKWLVVLSNLPGRHADLPGDQDDRREILPLETYRWNGDKININIKRTGADVTPPTNPEKKK